MEDVTDADYVHAKRVLKENIWESIMILYVQSDILLLADVFESFRNMYFKIHKLDPAKCVPAPGLA